MTNNREYHLHRFSRFEGEIRPPGSKSIANRALLLAALARGQTAIHHLPPADDVEILVENLPHLGIEVRGDIPGEHNGVVYVKGAGGPFPVDRADLDLGNAGTALRPLTALLAAGEGHYRIDGNAQMRRRPIGDLVQALQSLGVHLSCAEGSYPPIELDARGLPGGETLVSGKISSQFVSALLLAAPLARGPIHIRLDEEPVSKPYIDLTLAMMAEFGVSCRREGYRFFDPARGPYVSPGRYEIEPDATAATYFLGAGALPGCGPVRVNGLGSLSKQGDVAFVDVLRRMGASVAVDDGAIEVSGPPRGTALKALDIDMNAMPDAAMTLAVLALFCDGETHIRNIANLRVKESERVRGLRNELEKLGAVVREESDALHIRPPAQLRPARIETYDDHRMAMAFALAAFETDVMILDPCEVSKTYRGFFDDFLPLCRAE